MTRIVIDLEWNHPLAGRRYVDDLPGEIIQIGAAKIDDECNVIDAFPAVGSSVKLSYDNEKPLK